MVDVSGSVAFDGDAMTEVGEIDIPLAVFREMGSPKNFHLQVLRVVKTQKVVGLLLIPAEDGVV